MRNLESEFGESTNGIRIELNRLEEAGFLSATFEGNKKIFRANTKHPLFHELHSIVVKYAGIDKIIQFVIKRLGNVEKVFLTGDIARGLDSQIVDLVIVGDIETKYLVELIEKAEPMIKRKIRYLIFKPEEFSLDKINTENTVPLLLWNKESSLNQKP